MSPRRHSTPLRLQALEGRETPATFGEAWLDGQHVTLSFAPEGTPILGLGSSLGSVLSGLGLGQAKHDILKAFQTWASQSNLNVGVVGDDGSAYDATGALQHDPRYGDIRIAGRALAADIVALTSPSGPWSSNSGDIVVNTDKPFSLDGSAGTYDLFSVFLQEAGHAFGVGNSTDPASPMYETYSGVRTGLTTGDVSSIQSLYGVRQRDSYEGAAGNDTQATATPLTGPVEADISTTSDADWYSFTVPAGVGTWVRLKAAGVSLLAPRVEVYNAAGELLAAGQSADPQDNDVNVQVGALGAGATYYVKVSSAQSDVFGIGAYKLGVDTLGGIPATDPTTLVDTETVANGIGSAVTLAPVRQLVSRPGDYLVRSSLASALDADVFRVRAPASTSTQPLNLVVSVGGVGAVNLNPQVQVFNSSGLPLLGITASKSNNHLVLAVKNVTAGADYLVKVTSATAAVANYDMAAVFRTVLPTFHGANGAFNQAGQVTAAEMDVYQSQVMHLTLGTAGLASSDTRVTVTIYNYDNTVAFQMSVRPNQLESGTVFLRRGVYRVEVKVTGGSVPWLGFGLQMYGLTDPEGISGTDPSGDPSGGSTTLPPPPDGDGGTIILLPPAPTTTTTTTTPPPATVTYF
jgi:Matrixin